MRKKQAVAIPVYTNSIQIIQKFFKYEKDNYCF